jgi:hypothetical protein
MPRPSLPGRPRGGKPQSEVAKAKPLGPASAALPPAARSPELQVTPMTPLLANVSFGILAFMPLGWLFMAAIIVLESIVLSRLHDGRWWHTKTALTAAAANVASGVIGLGLSLWLNGGWWLVVWMPWVSDNEVNWASRASLLKLTIYYLVAFVLSVVIEALIEQLLLRKRSPWARIWRFCLLANVLSYLLGSIAMYSWSFGLWR